MASWLVILAAAVACLCIYRCVGVLHRRFYRWQVRRELQSLRTLNAIAAPKGLR